VIYKLADIGITATLLNFIDDGMDIFVDSYKADSDDATRSAMIGQGSSKPENTKTGDAESAQTEADPEGDVGSLLPKPDDDYDPFA
jgi:hypothetical protein